MGVSPRGGKNVALGQKGKRPCVARANPFPPAPPGDKGKVPLTRLRRYPLCRASPSEISFLPPAVHIDTSTVAVYCLNIKELQHLLALNNVQAKGVMNCPAAFYRPPDKARSAKRKCGVPRQEKRVSSLSFFRTGQAVGFVVKCNPVNGVVAEQ